MRSLAMSELDDKMRSLVANLKEGETVVLVDGTKPIATLSRSAVDLPAVPARSGQSGQPDDFITFLKAQPALNLGTFNRADLYEDVLT